MCVVGGDTRKCFAAVRLVAITFRLGWAERMYKPFFPGTRITTVLLPSLLLNGLLRLSALGNANCCRMGGLALGIRLPVSTISTKYRDSHYKYCVSVFGPLLHVISPDAEEVAGIFTI